MGEKDNQGPYLAEAVASGDFKAQRLAEAPAVDLLPYGPRYPFAPEGQATRPPAYGDEGFVVVLGLNNGFLKLLKLFRTSNAFHAGLSCCQSS